MYRLWVGTFFVLWVTFSAAADWLAQAVPSEQGFEGAVTVVSAAADEEGFGTVTLDVPYLDLHGNPKTGQARVYLLENQYTAGKRLPVFCHPHYEKDAGGAKNWCRKGWLFVTPHYGSGPGEYEIDAAPCDSYNLSRAIIQWARRLAVADRTRLHIAAESQGGYMTLAMAADIFPVTSAAPDVPVLNWCYNLNYFEVNKPISKYPLPPDRVGESPMPPMHNVSMLADWVARDFGKPFNTETYYRLSPVSYLARITCPVLTTSYTGDMLVPIEAATRTHLRPYDRARFPEGYLRDFDALTTYAPARKTLEERLPGGTYKVKTMGLQKNSYEITFDYFTGAKKRPKVRPTMEDRPWSKRTQWSILYLDEGGPAPYAAHSTYEWKTASESFAAYYQTAQIKPSLLTAEKLAWLIARYEGKLPGVPMLADGIPANRLNVPLLEQLDVVSGLLDFASLGVRHEKRLRTLYASNPEKPLGDSLTATTLEARFQELSARLEKEKR